VALLTQHKNKVSVTNAGPLMGAVDWDKFTGGDLTHSVTKLRRTAGAKKEVLAADSEVDNITTEAFIDPEAHAQLLVDLKSGERYDGATIKVQAIDNAGVPIGKPLEYFKCSVAKFTPPAADANGEEAAKLVVEWAVGY
jgi:hypothetical protein